MATSKNSDPRGIFIPDQKPNQSAIHDLLEAVNQYAPINDLAWIQDDDGTFRCRECGCSYIFAEHHPGCRFRAWGRGWLKGNKR